MPERTGSGPRVTVRGRAAAGLASAALVLTLAGCAASQVPAQPISIISAYVMQTNGIKTVEAYFVLSNDGPADRLLSVRSSAGGKVLMLAPAAPGVSVTRAENELTFPGHAVTKLNPTGMHLEILNSGPLHVGKDITLTLVFAHDGKLKVPAQVNNPATGSSGYFGP
ncbi:MAG TPA: copper chaperone PCu(A)C [Streptosporangiaceae bacterium]|nr:copper chaperone PCu(A)C [Streptosporangiaceae bacterium]